MATSQPLSSQPIPPQPQSQVIVPIKAGFMGEQGVGKTASAALLAAALSVLFHNRAPIHVTDPELGWQFLNPVIFHQERIPLVQRTVPTFSGMLRDIELAEREGACVWAVELGKIWIEIVRTLQKKYPSNWGMELRSMWDDFVARFLNSKMHCLVLGRIQDVIEEILLESGDVRSVKVGEAMKAGGQRNNFGYEPHLVLRLSLEQKPRVRKGKTFVDEGRMIHRAHVLKDRTWALNGNVFRWQDRDGYKPGDFKYVWNSLQPHFDAVQRTMARVTLDTLASSADILPSNDNGEFYQQRERKNALSAEIKAVLDLYFGGRAKEDIQARITVSDAVFGVKSKEAADQLHIKDLERGLRILQAFHQYPDKTDKNYIEKIALAIHEYDSGTAEMTELPF